MRESSSRDRFESEVTFRAGPAATGDHPDIETADFSRQDDNGRFPTFVAREVDSEGLPIPAAKGAQTARQLLRV
jgi:hypothetical protein